MTPVHPTWIAVVLISASGCLEYEMDVQDPKGSEGGAKTDVYSVTSVMPLELDVCDEEQVVRSTRVSINESCRVDQTADLDMVVEWKTEAFEEMGTFRISGTVPLELPIMESSVDSVLKLFESGDARRSISPLRGSRRRPAFTSVSAFGLNPAKPQRYGTRRG